MRAKSLLSGIEALAKGRGELGQVQILAVFLFLLLIPTTVIIAQNATINSTFHGEITRETVSNVTTGGIAELPPPPNETINLPDETTNITRFDNQTINETTTELPLNYTNETIPIEPVGNETNETIPVLENQTNASQIIIDINITNQTATNQTVINETINTTSNETVSNETSENETIPDEIEKAKPVLDVGIISPDSVTRGGSLKLKAYAKNTGSTSAYDLEIEWVLPSGFLILSGSGSVHCQEIAPETSCWNNVTAAASLSSYTGLNEIRVKVNYSE
jgi:hypothetical protein